MGKNKIDIKILVDEVILSTKRKNFSTLNF